MISMVTSQKVMKGGMPSTSPAMAGPRLSLLRRKAITPKTIARVPHMRFTTIIQIKTAPMMPNSMLKMASDLRGASSATGENPSWFPGAWINILAEDIAGGAALADHFQSAVVS